MTPPAQTLPATLGAKATLACLWEATAAKPGNVYRGADFADLTFADFVTSAAAIGPVLDRAADATVGQLVLDAVAATRRVVATNTNLGTLLLLAPLAQASLRGGVREHAEAIVAEATVDDARLVYEAIRLAAPGGLGEVDEADVAQTPEIALLEAMRLAEGRDLVARQYTHRFEDVLESADAIAGRVDAGGPLADAIVWTQLEQMSRLPDTLIARKCGVVVAQEAADRAAMAIEAAESDGDLRAASAELDFWLRADGHRRNPGATADVLAAALFVLLVEDRLEWPVRFYKSRQSAVGSRQ